MSKAELRYRKRKRINALFEEMDKTMENVFHDLNIYGQAMTHTTFHKGVRHVPVGSDEYNTLMTHPHNADRVDDIVEWKCKGFIGYKK
jgi:hypothetical protein